MAAFLLPADSLAPATNQPHLLGVPGTAPLTSVWFAPGKVSRSHLNTIDGKSGIPTFTGPCTHGFYRPAGRQAGRRSGSRQESRHRWQLCTFRMPACRPNRHCIAPLQISPHAHDHMPMPHATFLYTFQTHSCTQIASPSARAADECNTDGLSSQQLCQGSPSSGRGT